MAKKDFSQINTTPVYETIAKATQEAPQKKARKEYDTGEAAEHRENMTTAGRKGAKLNRINMAFSDPNYEYIETMSRVSGQSITKFVNHIIELHRADNEEIYQKALEFKAML